MFYFRRIVFVVVIVCLGLGACNGDDEDKNGFRPNDGGSSADGILGDSGMVDAIEADAIEPDAPDPSDAGEEQDANLEPDADISEIPTCDEPKELISGEYVEGFTVGSNGIDPNQPSACEGAGGGEAVYWHYVPVKADLTWVVYPGTAQFDAVAYVRKEECDGTASDAHCVDSFDFGGDTGSEFVEWRNAEPGMYYFFVDGRNVTDFGDYSAYFKGVPIVGEGEPCGGDMGRCEDGFLCDESTGICVSSAGFCDDFAIGDLSPGQQGSGDTTLFLSGSTCGAAGMGGDVFWKVTANSGGGSYHINVSSTDHDVFTYRMDNCTNPASTSQCTGGTEHVAKFDIELDPDESTYIVVDDLTGVGGNYTIKFDAITILNSGDTCYLSKIDIERCPADTVCGTPPGSDEGTCASACGI